MTGIDLNRAGTPLLEIVTEPDMRSATEAVAYAKALHALVTWLGVCDGNMQEGSFRCDANVSVRRSGETKLGTRCEIKNVNSFRFVEKAIDYEIERQIRAIEKGEAIVQETRLYDPTRHQTRPMRSKESADDYRYFPDPDLPPLLEIVTEPDMRASTEAVEYAKALHSLVVWLEICDGNMQEGSFRCDANVSVRRPGAEFGTRREIKNLNSFKYLQQAIDYEIQWQIDLIEDGGKVQQATVLFNPDTGETRAMRTKEDAHDYRYFPDPDLPPLVIAPEWVEQVRAAMPELPRLMAERFQKDYGLPAYDASMMTQGKAFGAFFEETAKACGQPKLAANWLMGEVSRRLNAEEKDIAQSPVSAATLAALIGRIADGTVSNNGARQVFDQLWSEGGQIDAIIEAKGLKQMSDSGELERILDEVLAANAKSVEEFRSGKEKAFNALVGQAMKATKGKANPSQVNELLKKKLATS
jgi:Asp-tRNA(Asn)/Glu-tRNA(Gln) amidotransferase B subunit